MIWFYLADSTTHHHRFRSHIPAVWAAVGLAALPLIRRPAPTAIFLAAIFLHLVLDMIGGGIMWGWPFSHHLFELVPVPATQSHWILSFVLHWTFLAEIAICTAALIVMRKPADKATATG